MLRRGRGADRDGARQRTAHWARRSQAASLPRCRRRRVRAQPHPVERRRRRRSDPVQPRFAHRAATPAEVHVRRDRSLRWRHPESFHSRDLRRTLAAMAAMAEAAYPVTLELDAPLEIARWRPLVHWLLSIPHYIVLYILQIALCE